MSDKELSGRELDAAVAERIMQWTNVQSGCYTPIGQEWCGDDPAGTGGFYRTGRKIIPRYSESIEAAWQIVEKMRRDHFRFACNDRYSADSAEWWAEFATLEYERGGQANSKSLPEAICRAALAAIESSKHE